MCEVYDLLRPSADGEFWNFGEHQPEPGVYVFGRQQMTEFKQQILTLSRDSDYQVVFANSAEGSTTLTAQLEVLGLTVPIQSGRILLISGGDLPPAYPYILHEHFLTRVLDYQHNIDEIGRADKLHYLRNKPYKFLFLNGRARPHRKYLYEHLRRLGLLDQALWTMLDGRGTSNRVLQIPQGDQDLMTTNSEIRPLPDQYEVDRYRGQRPQSPKNPHQFIKHELFNNEWGDIYLDSAPYKDSYFSLVSETVFETHNSFRTEKIAKPLAIGHPWICATNAGFYRGMRDLGFQTFHTLIDESFDSIDSAQDRMDRIIQVVQDLCSHDLDSFVHESRSICKYNQQHLREFIQRERSGFAARFQEFITRHA